MAKHVINTRQLLTDGYEQQQKQQQGLIISVFAHHMLEGLIKYLLLLLREVSAFQSVHEADL